MRFLLVLLIPLLLFSCDKAGEEGDGISGTFDLSGAPISVTITVHESQSSLRQAYRELYGEDMVEQGFAVATMDNINGHHCEIHVTTIRSVTDNTRINTWGHELAHCVYGLWH